MPVWALAMVARRRRCAAVKVRLCRWSRGMERQKGVAAQWVVSSRL